MIVLKFGGTSVGSVNNLKRIQAIVEEKRNAIIVVSAFSGVTNQLKALATNALTTAQPNELTELRNRHLTMINGLFEHEDLIAATALINQEMERLSNLCKSVHILKELSPKTLVKFLATGEILSSKIIYQYFKSNQLSIDYLDSLDFIAVTGDDYLNATVDLQKTIHNCKAIVRSKNYIAPGFIAKNEKNELCLLGRGGSDYTATLFGAGIHAERIELWSDIDGMHNANPNLVKLTESIKAMTYEEAFEMSHFGAKVLYPLAVKPAMQLHIPIVLKNTLSPEAEGSWIKDAAEERSDKLIGVSSLPTISVLTLSGIGLSGRKGTAKRLFAALEQADSNVLLISQSCSEQSICFCINSTESQSAKKAIEAEFKLEMSAGLVNPVDVANNHVIVALIGDNMRHQAGLSGKVFSVLGENNINVVAIAQGASERNISIVVHESNEKKAVNVIHEEFFKDTIKRVHLFIAGVGNVGSEFLDIIEQQRHQFYKEKKIEIDVIGIANSSSYLISEDGIDSEFKNKLLANGIPYQSFDEFVEKMKQMNLRNTIFIDNTASHQVASTYLSILSDSISVIGCNKIAPSSTLSNYNQLKQTAIENNCKFQYETAVGAALPVIKTIQNIRQSGDKIHKIKAVLSGSLNFIFNQYDGSQPFVSVVQQAREEGFTEPDPRIDLTGVDVMRKLLILSREAGYDTEMTDVKFQSFLPEGSEDKATVEEFMDVLSHNETHFQQLIQSANANNTRLKVIAEFKNGELLVSLQQVTADSPFYHIDGKDNIVSIYTDLYKDEPLIVKGAGAGARITASGVFSDLMLAIND